MKRKLILFQELQQNYHKKDSQNINSYHMKFTLLETNTSGSLKDNIHILKKKLDIIDESIRNLQNVSKSTTYLVFFIFALMKQKSRSRPIQWDLVHFFRDIF